MHILCDPKISDGSLGVVGSTDGVVTCFLTIKDISY